MEDEIDALAASQAAGLGDLSDERAELIPVLCSKIVYRDSGEDIAPSAEKVKTAVQKKWVDVGRRK
jgi:hypothetical protein